jgi:hypothetical protein
MCLIRILYIDISSIKERSFARSKFWALIFAYYTDFCWSHLLKNKFDLKGKAKNLLIVSEIDVLNVNQKRGNGSEEIMVMYFNREIKIF